MNVAELRKELEGLPDDATVVSHDGHDGYMYVSGAEMIEAVECGNDLLEAQDHMKGKRYKRVRVCSIS